jgi:hypothetical protein
MTAVRGFRSSLLIVLSKHLAKFTRQRSTRHFRGPRESACIDHEPSASVVEKWQADCDAGAGHLLATIKPKIVRHTIILSTNNLFLLTPLTSPSGRFANPAVINPSIRSSRSLPGTFRVILFFGVEHVRYIFLRYYSMIHNEHSAGTALHSRILAINLQHIRYAVAARDQGSFRRAAESLFVQQSTLSRAFAS